MEDVSYQILTKNRNQFNLNFATLRYYLSLTISSNISHLTFATSGNRIKIFSRTLDGVARLLSPITGRTLCSSLPLLEAQIVLDSAYFFLTDRMYVLLNSGAIYVYRTDLNPCTIVDVWNGNEARDEGIIHLVICHGEFTEEDAKICPPDLHNFAFLLASTRDGYVLIFGRGGTIVNRCQLHSGEISHLAYEPKNHMLLTAGADERIRISLIKPFHPSIVQVQIDILLNFLPQAISMLNDILCVAASDASIYMFLTNIKKQGNTL